MLKERIQSDLKVAMLARDTLRTQTLQGLKAAILYEEVAKNIREKGLDDTNIEQLIAREVKKRDEAAGLFEQGGNQASADKERAEKEVLIAYLPAQLSDVDTNKLIDAVIASVQPTGKQDMGKVIGAVKAKAGNTVDGATIARLVKEKLE